MEKRRWNKAEKLKILEEAKKVGVQITLRKYGVYPATYYSWRKKYEIEGEAGISDRASRRKDYKYIRQLEDEISLLKQLLAERDLEIALQDELLKKKYPWARRKT
jgi:putative transposase